MDTRYKWKPINGENHEFFIVVMQWKAPTSSITTDFLLAPTYKRFQPQFLCNLLKIK